MVKRKVNVKQHPRRLRSGSRTIVRRHLRTVKCARRMKLGSRIYQGWDQVKNMDPVNRQRNCYNCGKELKFNEMCNANPKLSDDYLKKLWFNPDIELYCCYCIEKARGNSNIEKRRQFIEENALSVRNLDI